MYWFCHQGSISCFFLISFDINISWLVCPFWTLLKLQHQTGQAQLPADRTKHFFVPLFLCNFESCDGFFICQPCVNSWRAASPVSVALGFNNCCCWFLRFFYSLLHVWSISLAEDTVWLWQGSYTGPRCSSQLSRLSRKGNLSSTDPHTCPAGDPCNIRGKKVK